MATKGTKNIFGGFMNAFGKSSPKDEKQQAGAEITESHASEKEMKALLQQIDLGNPQNKLSAKKFKELNIEGVIRYAYSELKYPLIVEYDLTNLDNSMKYIISALEQSIKEGLDTTAEWACIALVFAVKSLRAKVDGIDVNYADALWECRSNYAFNLELLVKSCIEYDRLSAELAVQKTRRKERREELDKLKSDHIARRNSGQLDFAMSDLTQNAHNPAAMSDEARALDAELNKLHSMKNEIIEIDTIILTKQASLENAENEINSRRNILSDPPRVKDPEMQSKINEANRRYRESLRKELNEAEEALRSYDVHISAMRDLANHSLLITKSAKAIQEMHALQIEELERRQIEQQGAQIRARDAANSVFIQENVKIPEPVVEIVQEQIEEQEPVVEYVYE